MAADRKLRDGVHTLEMDTQEYDDLVVPAESQPDSQLPEDGENSTKDDDVLAKNDIDDLKTADYVKQVSGSKYSTFHPAR